VFPGRLESRGKVAGAKGENGVASRGKKLRVQVGGEQQKEWES